jgi:hypothetical protein
MAGETEPSAPHSASQQANESTRRRGNEASAPLLQSQRSQPASPEEGGREIAGGQQAAGSLSIVVGFPFWLVGKALSYALRPLTFVLGGEEAPKDNRIAAARFAAAFERQYGSNRCPPFLQEGYREAISVAARAHKVRSGKVWRQ